MDFPESNLQPEAQKWRRAVEKTLTELQRRTGALQTNTKTTGARFSSLVTQTASVERQVGETINDLTEVAEKVERKDQSVWQPKAPTDPEHGQRWFNVKDGNVLRVWIDYGDYARYNFIRNPSFSENTDTWQATGAALTRTVGPDPMARLDVPADVAEPGDVVLIETEGRSHGEWLEGDPDDPDSGPSGFVGTPWAAGADVQVVSGNEDVRAILDVITDTDVVVSTSGPVEVSAASITRVLATPVEGENILEEVRLRLTVTNLSGGDVVFVDKVMLEAATDTGGDYFDGDMPGVEWIDDPEAGRISQWLGYPDWYELRDEKILHEMEEAREWIDETGQELVQRLGSAEGAIGTVENVLEDVRSNVGRKMWSGDSFTSSFGTFTVEPVGSGRLRIAHVEGTSPVPVRYLCAAGSAWSEWLDGPVVVVEVPGPGTYGVFASDVPGTTDTGDATDVLGGLEVTAEMMSPDYGWVDMEWPDIDWSDAEIGLDQLRDAGLLDPDVWARLFEDVVVGGVVAATEAFIGSNAIIDNAVQARHVVASESLWAKLATFARVTTDMLLVGGSNLLPDPRFEDPELTAGRISRSAATEVSGGYQATGYFYWMPSTTAADVRRYAVPVTAGDTYRIEIPVTLTSALSTTPRLETWNTSATGRLLRSVTDWSYEDGILSYTYTVPEGVGYLSPIIYRATSYTVHPGARVTLMADSRLLVDGAVTARALNVVHELPSGDLLRIDPDGIRVWRAGNSGPYPNIALTAGDGFCIQTDTGDGLLWIDPATGDLHTAGAVTTGGTITGATINIPGALYASPATGVSVGGALQIYTRSTYTSTEASGFFTDPVPVAPGKTYHALYRLERDIDTGDDHHQVWVVWFNGGTEVSRRIIVNHPGAPLYDEGSITDAALTAPAGVTHVRLLFTRDIAPVTTRVSDIAIFEASEGNIIVSGDVRGSAGVFDRLQVGGTVLEGYRVAVPTGLGGFDPSEDALVYSVAGTAQLFGTLFRTLANVAVGDSFRQCLQLPPGFRPAYSHYTTVMNNDGQVFQAIINPAGVVSIRTPGGSQIWQQGKTMPLSMFGPFILGGQ